ncbi:MAG: hypothetical protein K2H18_03330, partial [Muribaculaceae bacterium]|nr:hypothetical protein [Muribaculaceae bacterium]
TDRIRGILTAYRECKKRNLPFFIYWKEPFLLTDYLLPASFDWRISDDEITRSRLNSRPVAIDDMNDVQSLKRLEAALSSPSPQLHLYTNADSARGEYAYLYRELFRPTELLVNEVERHKRILGENYVAVTTRFLTLLGDFNDWCDVVLSPEEQKILMQRVGEEFKKVTADLPPSAKILVTSDSMKFLEYMRNFDSRVYIVDGKVEHIDLTENRDQDSWLKTFVDQYLIMGASKVIRLRTGKMYASGFARFGAEVGEAEFVDHIF